MVKRKIELMLDEKELESIRTALCSISWGKLDARGFFILSEAFQRAFNTADPEYVAEEDNEPTQR